MLRRLLDSDGIVHLELPRDLKLPDDEYVVIDTKRANYRIYKLCMRDFSLLDAVFTDENVTCIACITR